MHRARLTTALTASLMACSSPPATDDASSPLLQPMARVETKTLEVHGHGRIDDYFWLRQRDDPEVSRYASGHLALQASLAVLIAISLWSVFTNGQSENYTDQD